MNGQQPNTEERLSRVEQWQADWREYELEKSKIIAMALDPIEYERKISELLDKLGF